MICPFMNSTVEKHNVLLDAENVVNCVQENCALWTGFNCALTSIGIYFSEQARQDPVRKNL